MAQHGTIQPDESYPYTYAGDTWSGVVTSINEGTQELTLTYKKGDEEQAFVCVLPGGLKVTAKDGSVHEIKLGDLKGRNVIVYYDISHKKVNGKKVRINQVIRIKPLPPAKG
jgi:hypothetical protein